MLFLPVFLLLIPSCNFQTLCYNQDIFEGSCYHQSMVDLQLLDRGDSTYQKLNQSYIIFICVFDLFGKGRHIYTFENICREDNSITLGDRTTKIFLNAKGTMDDVSRELKAFLDYVAGQMSEDDFVSVVCREFGIDEREGTVARN